MAAGREFLSRQTRLTPGTDEWNSLEYSLQLSIGSPAALIKNAWSVQNPHIALNFNRNSQRPLVLNSWLDTATLNEENRIDELCNNGFKVPASGLVFNVGSLKLESPLQYNQQYEFLLTTVFVGRSHVINVETLETNQIITPEGYDSVYLYYPQQESDSYQHNYLIHNSWQCLPSFIVQFEIDANREQALQTPLCEMCEESQATVYCEADDASLCGDCDDEVHNKGSKIFKRHRRIAISDKPKRFGACPSHSDTTVEFYCTVCKIPVCINCKMVGNHSTTETHSHGFIKIFDAYNRALAESKEPDPIVEQRRGILQNFLQLIDDRAKEIKRNAEDVESKIYKILQDVLTQLQKEAQSKIDSLHSAEMEIRRQLEEMAWIESFLNYQQDVLSPAMFMVNWSRHLQQRNSLTFLNEIQELDTVKPDIRVEGNVHIQSLGQIEQKLVSDTESIQSGPKTTTSKFRSQLFNRYQLMSSPDRQGLKNLVPNKPTDSLTLKFSKIVSEDED